MDPLSEIAGVVGILDVVSKLSATIYRLRQDYKLADQELDTARRHALLLREEISRLETVKPPAYPGPRKPDKYFDDGPEDLCMDELAFSQALSTACQLLQDIEEAFPQCSDTNTWKGKLRYAIKDKKKLEGFMQQLQATESTLNGILSLEQLRVTRLMCEMLRQQQSTMQRIDRGEILTKVSNMAIVNPTSPEPEQRSSGETKAQVTAFDEPAIQQENAVPIITRPNTLVPWTAGFSQWGVSGHVTALPREDPGNTTYRASLHLSILRKMYSLQLQVSWPKRRLSFDRMLRVRNLVHDDSGMPTACKNADFDKAYDLLTRRAAHGNDMTASGWPVLDYAIESGSVRLVRLLLEHGADPNMTYGEHNMTPLQSCFLRGNLDIARILISKGANIEHLDDDGHSVLSYLWIVDKRLREAAQFMALCLAYGFSEVNACDSRGWTAFHRAAAIGTHEDIKTFLLLGASIDLRAEWYGWTAVFFAAAHDNVETFEMLVAHSGPEVYAALDGDGWGLLHCCVYFGAFRVMKLLLQSGVDVNQKSLPAPLFEDPELSYKVLTPMDIAVYIGPRRKRVFMDALVDTDRDKDLDFDHGEGVRVAAQPGPTADTPGGRTLHPAPNDQSVDASKHTGDEDTQKLLHYWTLLYWASYNGSPKVKKLLLMTGTDPEHLDLAERRGGLGAETFSFECH